MPRLTMEGRVVRGRGGGGGGGGGGSGGGVTRSLYNDTAIDGMLFYLIISRSIFTSFVPPVVTYVVTLPSQPSIYILPKPFDNKPSH